MMGYHDGQLCPVCGQFQFGEDDNFEICEICGWEDDSLQRDEPDFAGGANKMSLNQARQAWKEKQRIKCPVCGQYEFERDNSLEICEVCGWQNDGDQLYDPNEERGANQMSLNQARKAWAQGKPVK